MKTFNVSRKIYLILGLFIFVGCLFHDNAWSQEQTRGRNRRQSDPASFLVAYQEASTSSLLKLTKEQEEKLEPLKIEYRRTSRIRSSEEQATARKELEDKAIGLLTEDQKQVWEQRKTEILKEKEVADAAGAKAAESTPATTRGAVVEEKIPEGAITVISFGADAAAKTAEANSKTEDAGSKVQSSGEKANLTFAFRYAPWSDVLKLFAEVNDLSLDLNEVPSGTFNYIDTTKSYTMTEAMDVINGYLISRGYILVRRDRFLVCLNMEEKIPPNLVPTVSSKELGTRGLNELLTLILPLDGLDAEKTAKEVQEILSKLGTVYPLKSANSLVITDIGSYLRRVNDILGSNNPNYARETAFKAIPLKHISADVAEQKVRRLFNLNTSTTGSTPAAASSNAPAAGGGGRGGAPGGGWGGRGGGGGFGGFGGGMPMGMGGMGGPDAGGQPGAPAAPPAANPGGSGNQFAGKIQVIADTHTKHLLVIAPGIYLKIVEDAVTALDRDTDASGQRVDLNENPTTLKTYPVSGGDTAAISRMLNNVIPGVVVGEDAKAGKIWVQATKDEHEQVQKIIAQNSGVSSEFAVIELTAHDPAWIMQKLRALYLNESPRAPSIEADPAGRRIFIRGSAEQLTQIKTALREMGETSVILMNDGQEGSNQAKDRGTTRRLNLGSRDPDEILSFVQKTWDAAGHSPIRIVVPSMPNPIKDRVSPSVPDSNRIDSAPFSAPKKESIRTETKKSSDNQPTNKNLDRRRETENPREEKRAPKSRPATTQLYPRLKPVVQAVQTEENDDIEPIEKDQSTSRVEANVEALLKGMFDDERANADPEAMIISRNEQSIPDGEPESRVGITVMGSNLILTSPDTKALDQLEEILGAIINAIPPRTLWTVFYLRTADATECATMIEKMFPQGSVTTTPSANDGLFGSFMGGFGGFGRGLANSANSSQNQTPPDSQSLRIITDVRSNALYVTGPKDLIRDIKFVLAVLDSNELPESMRDRSPKTIPVEYADVEEVAEVVKDVFKDLMGSDQPQQQQQGQQGQQGMNPFTAMMFGGNRPGGGAPQARKPAVELTIGVDRRTNQLFVSCNENTYKRVETVVLELDRRAKEARRTVRLVELKTADPSVVQSTLTSLIPRVTVSATRAKRDKQSTDASQTPGQGQNQGGQAMPNNPNFNGQFNTGGQGGGGRNTGGGGRTGGGNGGGGRRAN